MSLQVSEFERVCLEGRASRGEEKGAAIRSSIIRELQCELQGFLANEIPRHAHHLVLPDMTPMRQRLWAWRSLFVKAGPSCSPPAYMGREEVESFMKAKPSSYSRVTRGISGKSRRDIQSLGSSRILAVDSPLKKGLSVAVISLRLTLSTAGSGGSCSIRHIA